MLLRNPISRVLLAVVVLGLSLVLNQCSSRGSRETALGVPVDGSTAVRFFYSPSISDYFHVPLVFRVVKENDPRLSTAPVLLEGRTAYVTNQEMRELIQGLGRAGLSWQRSGRVEELGSYKLFRLGGVMVIRIVSSKGTVVATLGPPRICTTLEPLDSTLKTPRPLWELQRFRLDCDCNVPGFNDQAYPDHY